MSELPESMNNRFFLYLSVLPVVQHVAIYLFFASGAVFLIWSVVKILLYKPRKFDSGGQWLEQEMNKKRLSFLNERRNSLRTKEMDVYFNSLLNPDGEILSSVNLDDLKEDVV